MTTGPLPLETPDVDIDLAERDKAVALFPEVIMASEESRGELIKHKTGVHFQNIPVDPISGLSAFPYKVAEDLGYYKIDFLHYSVYDTVMDRQHLRELMAHAESDSFDWGWFQQKRFFNNTNPNLQLTQLSKHQALCAKYPPKSVLDVAILNALIRPRKSYLKGRDWDEIKRLVWEKLPDEEGYFFKKSHAVAFALVILIHMQLIDQATSVK